MSYLLSSTNSVTDIKAVMQRTYSQLGYASDELYTTAIETVSIPNYLIDLRPIVGDSLYEEIQVKDKTSLESNEQYIYWAEVYLIVSRLCGQLGNKQIQSSKGGGTSFSSEGYSQSVNDTKKAGYFELEKEYYNQAKELLSLAGYADALATRLVRGGNFYTDPRNNTNEFYK